MLCVRVFCLLALVGLLQVGNVSAQQHRDNLSARIQEVLQQGADHMDRREYSQARSLAAKALAANPTNPQLYELLSAACGAQGDWDAALEALARGLRYGPREFGIYYNLGCAHAAKRDWTQSLANYTEALRLQPDSYLAHVKRALVYHQLGEERLVQEDLEAAERCGKGDANAHYAVGSVYVLVGDSKQAIRCYTEAIRLEPEKSAVYSARGISYAAQKDWDAAISDFSAAIRLDLGNAEYYYNRGLIFFKQRRYAEARSDFDRAEARGGQEFTACAYARLLATCPDPAVRDGRRAVLLARRACEQTKFQGAVCLDVLATACAEAGQWDEAIHWEEQALQRAPGEDEGMRIRLELYRLHEPCREPLIMPPADQSLSSAAEMLLQGIARGQAGDEEGAISDLRRALELNPRLIAGHYSLGMLLSLGGEVAEAARHFNRCLELDANSPQALAGRGQLYLLQGKAREALADTEAALALEPRHLRAHQMHAWALASLGKLDQAHQEMAELEREPSQQALHFVRGHCNVLEGRYAEAVKELTAGLRCEPSSALGYAERAVALAALGKREEAQRDLELCVRRAPSLRAPTEERMAAVTRQAAPMPRESTPKEGMKPSD